MKRTIELAKCGQNTTTPNPNVGCVIVKDEEVIGEGFHAKAGQAHAEINALNDVVQRGLSAQGATAYVTLEPCSHYGRTPPCADALIAAGITEVIIGSRDPNPQVSGRGVEKLRAAGITVTEDSLREQCDELNLGFFKRMTTGMPWVTVKLGMSLDAKIATASGQSQWITGEASREDVQYLRAASCAIMTSSATVIADNPSLNVRLSNTTRQPKRVVVDSQLRVSVQAKLFALDGEVLVYHSQANTVDTVNDSSATTVIGVPKKNNHADLVAVLHDLGTNQQCNRVLVEAGGCFAAALLTEGVVDELIIYQAPMLLGEGGKSAFALPSVKALSEAPNFIIQYCEQIGTDSKLVLRKS